MGKKLIGIFDSGVGGLTVARHVENAFPHCDILYFGDTRYVPYGSYNANQVLTLVNAICRYLVGQGADALVMACNTSSALALGPVRTWCQVPVIGIIDEAAKAAVDATVNGKIGVIATRHTASSGAYERAASLASHASRLRDLEKFGDRAVPRPAVKVYPMGCPKLVPLIEAGITEGPRARAVLEEYLVPLQQQNVDTLVLGCTHYPFMAPLIQEMMGPDVRVIDPALFVAGTLEELGFRASDCTAASYGEDGMRLYRASGDPREFARVAGNLLDCAFPEVKQVDLHVSIGD